MRVVGAEVRRAGEHARSISFVIICVMPSDRNRTRTARARGLRRNSTDAERRLWTALRDSGFNHAKFRRQTPIGKYIVDFVSFRHKLVIGIDGGHHQVAGQSTYDAIRTRWLQSQGFRVLRFWNSKVHSELETVLSVVFRSLEHPSP